ncbi:response regulator [Salipiger sp. PrR002]|uniref:response regulator n=1 Tax=Salipiger sp. PrR002 TaxID=2706489 RepID=UPI0013BDBCB9|nr:response regulator [Salipiger sp. PrR002]NDW00108.1 response regulator [Salipiger sp. PrR002]NDW56883.1 response regulator [Salipiger sp. PrR004]
MARILLLLPDHDQRRALDRILSEGGHAAFQTATADDARPLIESGQYDLVMMDPDLPDQDGFSFLRDLRARNDRQPIVVLNRYAKVATTLLAKGLGASGILTMPFTRGEFFSTIDDAIAA